MSKCINNCVDPAELSACWPSSRGPMAVNFCGSCSAQWWNQFKNTPAGQGAIFGPVKSLVELQAVCAEHQSGEMPA